MNLKEAMERIEALERRVRELEARPSIANHYHYYQPQPLPAQGPIWVAPQPAPPPYTIMCGGAAPAPVCWGPGGLMVGGQTIPQNGLQVPTYPDFSNVPQVSFTASH
jgi:hypothetical protein